MPPAPIAAFAGLARAYVALVDGAAATGWRAFAGRAAPLLAAAYAAGVDLPTDVEPTGPAYDRPASPAAAVRAVLGTRDAYHAVVEPYEDLPAAPRSLADDLADVYVDLAEGLAAWAADDVGAAAWAWRLALRGRAGERITQALRALHAMQFDETSPAFDDDDDPAGAPGR